MLTRRRRNKDRGLAVCSITLAIRGRPSAWMIHNRGSLSSSGDQKEMLRVLSRQTLLSSVSTVSAGRLSVFRFFSSRRSSEQSTRFITVPEDKIDFVINRYKAVGGPHSRSFS